MCILQLLAGEADMAGDLPVISEVLGKDTRKHFVLKKLNPPENHIAAQECAVMQIATGLFAWARK